MNENKMDLSIPYYSDNTRISNSAIGWFIKNGPLYLKNMLDGKEEGITGSFLEKGTMIHEYILQPEEFWKDYMIVDFTTPRVSQQREFCECYAHLSLVEPLESKEVLALKAYRQAYSNNKKDEVVIADALKLIDEYSGYIEYCKNKDTKKIISFADLQNLKKIKSNLEEHKKANELLFGLSEDWETHNEFHINWEASQLQVKCKSLLDRLCINHKEKKIILIDLKTTQNVYNFAHSVEEYDYYRQITFYYMAIAWYFKNVLEIDYEEYSFEAYIIAIGKDSEKQIRVFNMYNEKIINDKTDLISKALQEISYHISSGQWKHTRSYYENDGIEEL